MHAVQRGEFGRQHSICCWTEKIHALLKRARVPSSLRTQIVPTVKLILGMLIGRKEVAFYCNDRTKNTVNGQNAGFWNDKTCGVCSEG